jgi:hypothetical protein
MSFGDLTQLEALKAHYRRGGFGDTQVKRRLDDILQQVQMSKSLGNPIPSVSDAR